MQSNGNEEPEPRRQTEGDWSYDVPLNTALRYARQLHLSHPVISLIVGITESAYNPITLSRYSLISIAAASAYIASHILSQPRSLADIARVSAVSERTIHGVYSRMYIERYEMINETWRQLVGGTNLWEAAEILPSLTWPPLERDSTDGEEEYDEPIEEDDDSGPSALGGLGLVQELCADFRWAADDQDIMGIAQQIAEKMDSMMLDWQTVNPWTFAAAITYMASYLVFKGKTFEQISTLGGVNPVLIRNTYEVMYGVREEIIQEDWFEELSWTRENALYCLPRP